MSSTDFIDGEGKSLGLFRGYIVNVDEDDDTLCIAFCTKAEM